MPPVAIAESIFLIAALSGSVLSRDIGVASKTRILMHPLVGHLRCTKHPRGFCQDSSADLYGEAIVLDALSGAQHVTETRV